MAESITLQLSDTLLEKAQSAAQQSGQPIEGVLTHWLEVAAAQASEAALIAQGQQVIYTPLDAHATAAALETIWNEHRAGQHGADQVLP
jgi:hypothetical protein